MHWLVVGQCVVKHPACVSGPLSSYLRTAPSDLRHFVQLWSVCRASAPQRVNMNPCRKGGIQLARPDVSVYFFPFLFAETKTLLLCYWRIFPACCFPPLPSRSYLFSTSWRRGPPGAMPVTLAPASISGRLIQETEGNCRGAGLSFIWETLLLFASVYFLNLDASSL
jgi:hypothetical protein